ncbi:hypothetical protein HMPREF9997_01517 [Corynebacterium durum F0235]|uniref:Uncharacterized protein n=1 Tax=Corynebacterium durum F0235 TaxID=1035195 RepID=L1MGF8_9CORY|nr:hypothetical protein HMPREF9997_01517 [Corynebacterium durum F0235]
MQRCGVKNRCNKTHIQRLLLTAQQLITTLVNMFTEPVHSGVLRR